MIDQTMRLGNLVNEMGDQTPCHRCHWPKYRHVDGDEKACPMFIHANQMSLFDAPAAIYAGRMRS